MIFFLKTTTINKDNFTPLNWNKKWLMTVWPDCLAANVKGQCKGQKF